MFVTSTSHLDLFVEYTIYAAAITTGIYIATTVWQRLVRVHVHIN